MWRAAPTSRSNSRRHRCCARLLQRHAGDIFAFCRAPPKSAACSVLEEFAGRSGCAYCRCTANSSGAAQDAALDPLPAGQRKIVLATTIAETSLTIEGIRVVVDGGVRRYAQFDPATGMSRLVTGKISQAAADQRRGRAGRLSAGVCYRLWSEGTHASLARANVPEILHADLAPLALELGCWGSRMPHGCAGSILRPRPRSARRENCCGELEAIDGAARITAHGRDLARAGMHPRLAHMLVGRAIRGRCAWPATLPPY